MLFALSAVGIGVELDSEGASADSVTVSVGAPLTTGAGEGASDAVDDSSCFGSGFSSNCASRSDGSRRIIILDGFLILSDLLVGVDGDLVLVIVFDMIVSSVVDEVGEGWRMDEAVR